MRSFLCIVLVMAGYILCLPPIQAQVPAPDFDIYAVIEFPQPDFTFLRLQGPTAIPADFFYPGSNPFVGNVNMQADPLTDTVVMRRPLGGSLAPFPPGSSDMVPIELVALNLVSLQPITVTGSQPPELWQVDLDLSGPQSQGPLNITRTSAAGGTFTSQLPVQAQLTFTNVNNPMSQIPLPFTGTIVNPFAEPWMLGSGNRFLPGVDPLMGLPPTSVVYDDLFSGSRLGLLFQFTSAPEPSDTAIWLSVLIAVAAVCTLTRVRRNRRVSLDSPVANAR